jgi:hypothetical protein
VCGKEVLKNSFTQHVKRCAAKWQSAHTQCEICAAQVSEADWPQHRDTCKRKYNRSKLRASLRRPVDPTSKAARLARLEKNLQKEQQKLKQQQQQKASAVAATPKQTTKTTKSSSSTCDECETAAAVLSCAQCEQSMCAACDAKIHNKGARAKHVRTPLKSAAAAAATSMPRQQKKKKKTGPAPITPFSFFAASSNVDSK